MNFVFRAGLIGPQPRVSRLIFVGFAPFGFRPAATRRWAKSGNAVLRVYHFVFQLPTFFAVRVLVGRRVGGLLALDVIHVLSVLHQARTVFCAATRTPYFVYGWHTTPSLHTLILPELFEQNSS